MVETKNLERFLFLSVFILLFGEFPDFLILNSKYSLNFLNIFKSPYNVFGLDISGNFFYLNFYSTVFYFYTVISSYVFLGLYKKSKKIIKFNFGVIFIMFIVFNCLIFFDNFEVELKLGWYLYLIGTVSGFIFTVLIILEEKTKKTDNTFLILGELR